jgi:hypothetical protein
LYSTVAVLRRPYNREHLIVSSILVDEIGMSTIKDHIASFLGFIWSLFRLPVKFVHKRFTPNPRFKVEETTCYSVHKSFYLWGIILIGWGLSPLIIHYPTHGVLLTWIYIWAMFISLIMLLFEISTLKLVVCSGVFSLIIISAKYVEVVRHITILSHVIWHFENLRPQMNGGVCSMWSWLLSVPWILTIVESYRSGRKSFSPNGIEERNLLVGREITDRSGLHFVCHYPNLLQTFLGGGSGSLIAYNNSNEAVKEWDNILGLYFKWNRLDEILHQRSAVVDNAKEDPVEVEEVNLIKKA